MKPLYLLLIVLAACCAYVFVLRFQAQHIFPGKYNVAVRIDDGADAADVIHFDYVVREQCMTPQSSICWGPSAGGSYPVTELISQIKLSIQLETIRQCIKTSGELAKQMQAKSIPSAKCNSLIAQEMHKDFEIWEAAQLAADKALEDLVAVAEVLRTLVAPAVMAEDVIPDFICTACKEPVPSTINGICWDCDDAIQQAKSIEPCDGPCCAGTVVQMPRRGR